LISIDNSELDIRNWKLPSRTPSLKGATHHEVMTAEAVLFFVLLACPLLDFIKGIEQTKRMIYAA
jgi:hypothetical protein